MGDSNTSENNDELFKAGNEGNLLPVQELLERGVNANVNAKDDKGWTALHLESRTMLTSIPKTNGKTNQYH